MILSDNLFKMSVMSALFLIVLDILLLFVFLRKLPPLIPFFNSMPWGLDRLARPMFLFILFSSFIAVFFLNNFFGIILYKDFPLISRILSFSAFLFILLGLLGTIQIVLLVL